MAKQSKHHQPVTRGPNTDKRHGEKAAMLLKKAAECDHLGQRKEAHQLLDELLGLANAPADVVFSACNLMSRLESSHRVIERAAQAFSAMGAPVAQASSLLYIALRQADWTLAQSLIDQLRAAYQEHPGRPPIEGPRTHVLWCENEAYNHAAVRSWQRHTLPRPTDVQPPARPPRAGRRLRVGYLSSDFREHPTSRLIMGALRNHDPKRIDLFLYCSGWDDGSAIRKQVEACSPHPVRSVATLSDGDAAQVIKADEIDVLVELNGPTRANRMGILAYRPAPVQIDYLGWPGSVGGGPVDYVIGDDITVPEGSERGYAERVIRLSPVYQINDYAALPPGEDPGVRPPELPQGQTVLGMFNAISKVRRDVWTVWMRILQACPNSVLWILDPQPHARRRLLDETRNAGVDPARIVFAPRAAQAAHLARLGHVDLMLDPWPYGGHTSTSDALWAGVPVLAMAGQNFAGRVSGALLKAAGLPELVMPDAQAYVRAAVHLLQSPLALKNLKAAVDQRAPRSLLFNAADRTAQLEAAYEMAFDRASKGLPCVHMRHKGQPAPASSQAPFAVRPWSTLTSRTIKLATLDLGLVAQADDVMGAARDLSYNASASPRKRYLLCSTERSGSTLMAQALGASGQAGDPQEYLNPRLMAAWLRRTGSGSELALGHYLDQVEAARTSTNGVFGMKVHFNQLQAIWPEDVAGMRDFLSRFDHIVLVVRRDKLAQAVSLHKARSTQIWSSEDRKFLAPDDPRASSQARFDITRIFWALQHIAIQQEAWVSLLRKHQPQPVVMVYEDFVADMPGMTRRLLDAVGLTGTGVVQPAALQRQSSDADPMLLAAKSWLGWVTPQGEGVTATTRRGA